MRKFLTLVTAFIFLGVSPVLAQGIPPAGPIIFTPAPGTGGGGGGAVNSVNSNSPNIICSPSTGSVLCGATVPIDETQTGTTASLNTSYAGGLTVLGNASPVALTVAQAGTTGYEAGKSWGIVNNGAGLVTATTTTSVFKGGGGTSSFTIPQYTACWITSDGTNWVVDSCTALSSISLAGNNSFTGQNTFAAVLGSENDQTGTTYTLATTDCGKTVAFNNSGAVTVTIASSIVPTAGTTCDIKIRQDGAGQVSVNGSAVTPATLVSAHSYTKTFGQHAIIGLELTTISATATAVLTGDGA